MKKTLTTAVLALLVPVSAPAFQCTVCHSKNPAMVRMHKALQGRNCFDCHRMGEKLMGKGERRATDAFQRRQTETICMECHKKQ